jgi:hypothetical protein
LNNQPSVMLVAAKWWPLSARLAAALHRFGCTVSALCPPKHPLTHVSGIRRLYRYGGIFSLASLRRALHDCQTDIVIPCDDGVVARELLSTMSVVVVASEGPTGAATIVRVIQNEDMRNAAELIVSKLKLTGFYGLDFILEFGTGMLYLFERLDHFSNVHSVRKQGRSSTRFATFRCTFTILLACIQIN